MSSRHLARSIVLQSLYEWDFFEQKNSNIDNIVKKNITEFGELSGEEKFINNLISGVVENISELDKIISAVAQSGH